MNCPLCDRVKLTQDGKYPFVVHEFKQSFLMLGEHQFFSGYSVLVSKQHYKEMTEIPSKERSELFNELMLAHETIEKVFSPDKMNLCSLGNVCPHVHWHLFPRYKSDPQFSEPPWLRMHLFESKKISPEEAAQTIQKIRADIHK